MATRRHSTTSATNPVARDPRQCEVYSRRRHNSSVTPGLRTLRPADAPSPGLASDIARAQELYDAQCRYLRSTGYIQQLEQSISVMIRSTSSLPTLKRGICLALSHVAHFVESKGFNINTTITGLTQLAVFDTACQSFGIPRSSISVYDPWFTEADRAFLRKLGFHAPRDGFGDNKTPKMPALREPTLVFHPNLYLPSLFGANFSSKCLKNLVWLQGNQRSLSVLFGKLATSGKNQVILVDPRITAAFEALKRSALIASSHELPIYHSHVHGKCQKATCQELANILNDEPWKVGERRLQDFGLSSTANTLYWWPEQTLETLPAQFWEVDANMRIRPWS